MKLKLDEQGHVVVVDGKPVYVSDDGKEVAFDAPGTVATINRLNSEAKGHREAKEAAETKLKAFDGIEDPAAARKAIETLKNLDHKKLVDAGEVEKVKSEVAKVYEERIGVLTEENDGLKSTLHGEMIGGSFARSKFIAEKAAIPADLVQAKFGSQFKIEDGKIAAYDQSGNRVYSRSKPGEIAPFDEALEIIVDGYAHKDQILKGANGGGGGTRGSSGGAGKTMTRATFEGLRPMEQQTAMKDKVQIVD
jgi:hypothetical protein